MDVEMEKRKFLNLCGKRDRALLSGEKRMTLGDMERLTYLTEFFELENYGIALWKEFGDDVKEPFEAMMKDYHIRQEQTSIKRSAFFWSFGR